MPRATFKCKKCGRQFVLAELKNFVCKDCLDGPGITKSELNEMTKAELLELAEQRKISIPNKIKKADLIKLILKDIKSKG